MAKVDRTSFTTIPVPTILTQTLRVQRDFPNPIDYQDYRYSWLEPGNSIVHNLEF